MLSKKRQARLPQVRRRAGESLRERRERIVDENVLSILCVLFVVWFVYLIQQVEQWTGSRPQPLVWLSIAVFTTVVAIIWFYRLVRIARQFNRGERGERHVADVLEELRRDGYKPVHDIVGNGFNVDHVIVGPGGVFAIETKYRSGRGQITFRNSEGVFVGDRLEEKDYLKQARANAKTISDLIHENCGRREWVTPLVVFVGDWKVKEDWRDTNVRVLTPDRIRRYIGSQQPRLRPNEIELIVSHLERSARA